MLRADVAPHAVPVQPFRVKCDCIVKFSDAVWSSDDSVSEHRLPPRHQSLHLTFRSRAYGQVGGDQQVTRRWLSTRDPNPHPRLTVVSAHCPKPSEIRAFISLCKAIPALCGSLQHPRLSRYSHIVHGKVVQEQIGAQHPLGANQGKM